MDRHYDIAIVKTEEKEEKIVRTTELSPEDLEDVGGIGCYVETITTLLQTNERIEIEPYWVRD